MGSWLFCITVVVGSVAASIGGLILIRKRFDPSLLKKHHELAGHILGIVGTLNAVLLGLVIMEAQSRFQQARTNEAAESSDIADVRLYAEYLQEPTRSAINRHVCNYVKLVRDEEWDSPPSKQPSKAAVQEFHCLWTLVCGFSPSTPKEQAIQSSMMSQLTQAFDMRRFRITSGRHGLPPILWVVLITSSVITVLFTYFFIGENAFVQGLMVVLLTITLAMGTLVVYVLGNPYVGDWKIRPEQFTRIQVNKFPITSNTDPFATEDSKKIETNSKEPE